MKTIFLWQYTARIVKKKLFKLSYWIVIKKYIQISFSIRKFRPFIELFLHVNWAMEKSAMAYCFTKQFLFYIWNQPYTNVRVRKRKLGSPCAIKTYIAVTKAFFLIKWLSISVAHRKVWKTLNDFKIFVFYGLRRK